MNSNRNFDVKKMKRFNQDIKKKCFFCFFFSFLSKRTSKKTILFCFSNNLPYLCSIIKTFSMKKRLIFIISVFFAFIFMFASANRKEGASHRHNTCDGDADTEMQLLIYSRSSCS